MSFLSLSLNGLREVNSSSKAEHFWSVLCPAVLVGTLTSEDSFGKCFILSFVSHTFLWWAAKFHRKSWFNQKLYCLWQKELSEGLTRVEIYCCFPLQAIDYVQIVQGMPASQQTDSCFCVLLLGKQEISVNTIAQPGICNLSALPLFIRAVSGETLAGRFSK